MAVMLTYINKAMRFSDLLLIAQSKSLFLACTFHWTSDHLDA